MSLRRAWLCAAIPLVALAVATSCDDAPPAPAPTPDAGAQGGQLAEGVCPDAAPEAGEGCVVPEGTTCSFGACGTAIAQCTRGRWRFGGNPPPSEDAEAICPTDFPASESACPPCFPANVACAYGTCDGPDATATVSRASCDAGRWSISIAETCPVVVDAGPGADAKVDGKAPSDAGADVQRDADADVD